MRHKIHNQYFVENTAMCKMRSFFFFFLEKIASLLVPMEVMFGKSKIRNYPVASLNQRGNMCFHCTSQIEVIRGLVQQRFIRKYWLSSTRFEE